jgi:hypothetical protein
MKRFEHKESVILVKVSFIFVTIIIVGWESKIGNKIKAREASRLKSESNRDLKAAKILVLQQRKQKMKELYTQEHIEFERQLREKGLQFWKDPNQ